MYAADRVIRKENGELVYHPAYDEVHVDEKWFEIAPKKQRMYLSTFEKAIKKPQRKAQSKRHLPKVMFLTAVARPRFNADGECTFDGKIGMWPLVERKNFQK